MNTLVEVKFKRAFKNYRVGDKITPNGTLRDWLVSNGYVEIVAAGEERPAKFSARAVRKVVETAKRLV